MIRRLSLLAAASCLCLPVDAATDTAVAPPESGATSTVDGGDSLTRFDVVVAPIVAKMTLAEKIGQMTQADLESLKDFSEVRTLHLGSVLSGGGSDPKAGNSVQAWTDVYDDCQSEALKTRLAIPILYGIDAVHGHSNVLGAVVYPHNIGLGCADDEALVERIGRHTAVTVRATGIQWTFAPCVTVPRDDRWGRTYEGFSEDPERVTRLGAAQVRGLQEGGLSDPRAVIACAKHFLGDGGTSPAVRDSGSQELDEGVRLRLDQGDTVCDEATLRRIHLAPYLPCLEEGVATIMPSYSSWNGVKCSARKDLLTDLLKDELGFEGFLISDWNAIDQCDPDYKTAVRLSINAGMDMAMAPNTFRQFITSLTELVEEGAVPMERIDDAVTRILRVKAAAGLFDKGRNQLADRSLHSEVGSDAARAVAREAVRKSLVLLKNDGALPLAKKGHVHVAGVAADDLGIQCGGWTIEWQGKSGEVTTGGTTLLAGLREVAGDGARITHSADASGAAGADAVIVVVGEKPYAEGFGDNARLTLSDEDQAVVRAAVDSGSPVTLVLLSGRPLILGDLVDSVDAVVAAWLPGTEGQGVADVLFGDHKPVGTLSFTWPKSADQHPINVGDDDYDPEYAYGYGLTYED